MVTNNKVTQYAVSTKGTRGKYQHKDLRWPLEVTIHALKEEAKDEDIESGVEDD